MPVIGVLESVSAALWADSMDGFLRGLAETGFVEGRSLAIEYRWAEDHLDRLPALAADLVARKVAVIAANFPGARAAMEATQSIPIVFTTGTDPVATGLVKSLNHPGGNVTGVTVLAVTLSPKQVELLHELLPTATRFAVLVNTRNQLTSQDAIEEAQRAGACLGLEVIVVRASKESEIGEAFATAVEQRCAALVANDALFLSRTEQIAALGLHHGLPIVMAQNAGNTGVLLTYGASNPDMFQQAGQYVGRILKGEAPGELPILQPTKFQLVVNLKTAKVLGLKIPESFLVRADQVIE